MKKFTFKFATVISNDRIISTNMDIEVKIYKKDEEDLPNPMVPFLNRVQEMALKQNNLDIGYSDIRNYTFCRGSIRQNKDLVDVGFDC